MPYNTIEKSQEWEEENKEARKKYKAEWHQKNKERRNKKQAEERKQRRVVFNEYKKTLKCKECGFSHPAALDFHHRNPDEKEYTISQMIVDKPFEYLLEEIEKCDVLCANCHRILHYEENLTQEVLV